MGMRWGDLAKHGGREGEEGRRAGEGLVAVWWGWRRKAAARAFLMFALGVFLLARRHCALLRFSSCKLLSMDMSRRNCCQCHSGTGFHLNDADTFCTSGLFILHCMAVTSADNNPALGRREKHQRSQRRRTTSRAEMARRPSR